MILNLKIFSVIPYLEKSGPESCYLSLTLLSLVKKVVTFSYLSESAPERIAVRRHQFCLAVGEPRLVSAKPAKHIGLKILFRERVSIIITSVAHWIKNPFRRTSDHNHKYNHYSALD